MATQGSNIISVVDIGSSKILCCIAKIAENKSIEVLGVGYNVSHGINASIITNIDSVEGSILQAVESAEASSGEIINKIYVSISSNVLASQRIITNTDIMGKEITSKDLRKLLLETLHFYNKKQLEVLHTFVCEYILDENHGIANPIGMFADKLTCDIHVVALAQNTLLNIGNCISRCKLIVENYISASYASGIACLSSEEMKLGTILIEFGGGSTSISLFESGQMIYTDCVAIGGIHITQDIAKGLCMNIATAERLKTLYGSLALINGDKTEQIEIKIAEIDDDSNDTDVIMVNRATLIEIITARVEEIMDLLLAKLYNNNFSTHGKIVITGGGSEMTGLKEFISSIFGTRVRIGIPKQIENKSMHIIRDGCASTITGMLMHVASEKAGHSDSNVVYDTDHKGHNTLKSKMTFFKKLISSLHNY